MEHEITIRKALPGDLVRLTEIYNQAIADGSRTCDTKPFLPAEREEWMRSHEDARWPLYVCLAGAETVGYACFSPYRWGRGAVSDVAEISYYLDFRFHGQGIGSRLMTHLVNQAIDLRFRALIAILLDCNAASKALLEKFGFSEWGRLPQIATLGERQVDHLYFGKHLEQAASLPDQT